MQSFAPLPAVPAIGRANEPMRSDVRVSFLIVRSLYSNRLKRAAVSGEATENRHRKQAEG